MSSHAEEVVVQPDALATSSAHEDERRCSWGYLRHEIFCFFKPNYAAPHMSGNQLAYLYARNASIFTATKVLFAIALFEGLCPMIGVVALVSAVTYGVVASLAACVLSDSKAESGLKLVAASTDGM